MTRLALWIVPHAAASALASRFDEWADDGERARAQRFARPEDARDYRIAHAATRALLAAAAGTAPEALAFAARSGGKPHLVPEDGLCFSLSTTASRSALASARGFEVGVDIERPAPALRHASLLRRIALADELADTTWATSPERRLLALWTAKEAVLKLWGDGLRRDPRDLVARRATEVLLMLRDGASPGAPEVPVRLFDAGDGCIAALAVPPPEAGTLHALGGPHFFP